VSSSEDPIEVEVLVGPDEGLGARLAFLAAVDGLPGRVHEALEAVPPGTASAAAATSSVGRERSSMCTSI
jgi:hypothetical protein